MMSDEEVAHLLLVERGSRACEVVDRRFGTKAHAQADVAELQIEVDECDALTALGQGNRQRSRSQGLTGAPLWAEDAYDFCLAPRARRERTAGLTDESLLERKANALGVLRQDDDIVGAGLEDAPHEAVRRRVAEDHHRARRTLLDSTVDQHEGLLGLPGTRAHQPGA